MASSCKPGLFRCGGGKTGRYQEKERFNSSLLLFSLVAKIETQWALLHSLRRLRVRFHGWLVAEHVWRTYLAWLDMVYMRVLTSIIVPQFVSFYKFHRFVCVSAGDVSRKRCLPVPTVNVPQQGKVKSTAIVYTAVPVGLEEIWKLEPKRCCKSALLNFDLSQLRCTNSNLV